MIDNLGNRMKRSEVVTDSYLPRRIPCVLRLDGKSAHSYTRGFERPFDDSFRFCMEYASYRLCKEIENARFGYTQSDEISILLIDYKDVKTEAWFDYRIQKMASIAASICTAAFTEAILFKIPWIYEKKRSLKFDCRVFSLPKEEVTNYFLWREQDCTRNSIQAVGQASFSAKQLHGKSCDDIQEMLFQEKGINWNDTPTRYKRGVSLFKMNQVAKNCNPKNPDKEVERLKWVKDYEIPIITQNRDYIEQWVLPVPPYSNYSVMGDGKIVCEDLDISKVFISSKEVVKSLDETTENFKKNIVSAPIDIEER